jgi:large-conductance mechanosensitive channel
LAADGKGSNILSSLGSASFQIVPAVIAPEATSLNQEKIIGEPVVSSSTPIKEEENIISSPTHPDQHSWYKENKIEFRWQLPADAQAVSYVFDQELSTDPGAPAPSLIASTTFFDVEDGVWYFHLKIKTPNGWSPVYRYRVQIDTSPPLPFKAEVKQPKQGDWPQLFFRAKDKESGIKQYEVKVGSFEDKGYVATAQEAAVQLRGLEPGNHTAIVKAVDKAGNASYSTVHFTIEPLPAPTIDNYTEEIRQADTFFASGKTIPEASLTLYIQDKAGQIITAQTTSDKQGSWHIIYENNLDFGRYVAWVKAENKNGFPTEESKKISFLVSPSVFVKIGSFVVNYFTVLASLLFVALVIIFIIVLLISFVRKKLRRETIEVETVLRRHFKQLKQEARDDLARLAKIRQADDFKQEKRKIQARLLRRIEEAEKKILKEVKDVEDILE